MTCATETPATRTAPTWAWLLCFAAILVAAGWFGRGGYHFVREQAPDFEYFYKGGAWLVAHGNLDGGYDIIDGRVEVRGKLDWYWPFVPRVMTLIAWLPYKTAGYIWLACNLVAMIATLRLIGRHLTGLPAQDWPVTQFLPLVLLGAFWQWEFRLNQVNNLTLLLMVASFVCWQCRRPWISGFWLGLAVLIKLTPGLLVVWFLLKRQYRTALAAIITVLVAGPVSDVVALGPENTVSAYRTWAHDALTKGGHRGLVVHALETDWRNQSVSAVAARWLHPTNYATHFDNDPRINRNYADAKSLYLNIADLPRETIAGGVMIVLALSLVGLLWLARQPAERLSFWQIRFEWVLFVLAMLWFMPVMRRYHVIWALPALSLLGAGLHYSSFRGWWTRLTMVCIGIVVLAQLSMLVKPIEAGGTILLAVVALGVPLVLMLMRLRRRPAALPAPPTTTGASP